MIQGIIGDKNIFFINFFYIQHEIINTINTYIYGCVFNAKNVVIDGMQRLLILSLHIVQSVIQNIGEKIELKRAVGKANHRD